MKTRPRVLVLQHAVYPYRRPLFDLLADAWDLTVVFCVAAKPFRRWDTSSALDGARFRACVLPHVRFGPVVVNRGLLAAIRRQRYDVFVVGVIDLITLPQVLMLLLASRIQGVPLVVCEEFFPTSWYARRRTARTADAVRRFIYRRTAAFATWNPKAQEYLIACGVNPSHVFSGPHAYPTDDAPPSAPTGRTFVTLAYFLPRKGIDILIRAFQRVHGDGIRLTIAGGGPAEEALRAVAAGDERISFAGFLNEEGKRELLGDAYAFVLPTQWDPWALVVNEAFAQRVPAVITDAAGVSGVAHGAAIVVPAGDEDALRAAMQRLVDDPTLREELAVETTRVAAQWTFEAQAAPLREAVDLAIARASRTSRVSSA